MVKQCHNKPPMTGNGLYNFIYPTYKFMVMTGRWWVYGIGNFPHELLFKLFNGNSRIPKWNNRFIKDEIHILKAMISWMSKIFSGDGMHEPSPILPWVAETISMLVVKPAVLFLGNHVKKKTPSFWCREARDCCHILNLTINITLDLGGGGVGG